MLSVNMHRGLGRGKQSERYRRLRQTYPRVEEFVEPEPVEDSDWRWYDYEQYDWDQRRRSDRIERLWYPLAQRVELAVPFNPLPRGNIQPSPEPDSPPREDELRARCRVRPIEPRVVEHLLGLYAPDESEADGEVGRSSAMTDLDGTDANLQLASLQRHCAAMPAKDSGLAVALVLMRPFWLRSPCTWQPTTADDTTGLVAHLLLAYPVPAFLLAAWRELVEQDELRWMAWLITLGQGGSLRRLTELAQQRDCPGDWPTLPKKLPGLLAQVPARLSGKHALMAAEVLRLGGSQREITRLRRDHSYVIDPTLADEADREFWEGCVRWLSRCGSALDDHDCALILAWARHRQTEAERSGERFDWSGRSVEAARREAVTYDRWLRARRNWWGYCRWRAQGWGWSVEIEGESWEIHELVDSHQLERESAIMHHCVRGYASVCHMGRSAITTLRHNGEPCLTIEVNLATKAIIQVRGHYNRLPTAAEQAVVDRWHRAAVMAARYCAASSASGSAAAASSSSSGAASSSDSDVGPSSSSSTVSSSEASASSGSGSGS
ncbi:MAG: PcfJ domain-containing protein, partial [Myxococcales bacterium]|nr:PcfJ domain-containing protein [Myxococcales bacterium]